ncbi:hypothetical protein DC498_25615 [Terrimonas sp.]|nr:hypothetical protein DC498_25615 [Terrimonas sp.]
MRCASSVYSALRKSGIISGGGNINSFFRSMNPGALYRFLNRSGFSKTTIENMDTITPKNQRGFNRYGN